MGAFEAYPLITPFLWFDGNAEEAAEFYVSVFPNSRVLDVVRATSAGPGPEGSVVTISFELDGLKFTGLNGGPHFPFTNAVSFVVRCETQEQVDHYWEKLGEGGKEIQCGWVTDQFGLAWQVTPAGIHEWIRKPKAMRAMMGMKKLVIAELKAAAEDD